ncbi:monovalent cation/H(+) antiporter subunit G [Cypionkella sp.]|jgi:multicomponent K+:H+ antiporter subunit G|uniref:cation:proton antiporter n=1 Tax=Cypionkella sp. TaxID=2811411 RepID=UPI002725A334|nr:monovalent cation/H(+) antiporter subunit G [Cypionkella sp.]MDO8985086.1 monovalent cation/H(+) antiporter subunit G [Cypionkella sp.]MDP2047357.1 monovalent cation/H(+) antiporter subunit G [Cypionkella sp.]
MSLAVEILISALLIIGGSFGLIGSFGLLKLREPMQRLHAPTKATTVGVGASLIAAALTLLWQTGSASWQGVMVAAFLFLTAPLSGLMLAKAHRHLSRPDLPPTGTKAPWAGETPPKP